LGSTFFYIYALNARMIRGHPWRSRENQGFSPPQSTWDCMPSSSPCERQSAVGIGYALLSWNNFRA